MTREEFEDFEMEEIAEAVRNGYYSGMTIAGSTWSLEVNFDYERGEADE